ncbi:hypothetical protein PT974_02560 [Cladobotryum mycophilum]|uniref:N-acetyltransferase domain-containing protein n=1 Tax=Cladobotryum mycophilum TaxID=491253 RepID=A0ABR0SYM4_9HYPO
MGTPFISLLEPTKLEGFQFGASPEAQPQSIPKPFLDAMEVREEVFVKEQGVAPEFELDLDDPRSCHWVVYASVNTIKVPEVKDDEGTVVQPRKSSTSTVPAGTIRLVPFPHEPHPKPGGKYWNYVLEGEEDKDGEGNDVAQPKPVTADRPTTFHDGKEPYVKLGRLAVKKEFRGNSLAGLLVQTALDWIKQNPSYFDPSVKELGLEQIGAATDTEIPQWEGLVCVHAQEAVIGAYKRWGFEVDEGMGTWWEEGIPHVGMFKRLEIGNRRIRI